MLTALRAEYADPGTLANRHFCSALCGAEHVAGRFHTAASVRKLGRESLRRFYDRHIAPGGSTVVVAGDMEAEAMRERWRPLFSSWQRERRCEPVLAPPLRPLDKTRIRIVDKPDISQTTLMIGHGSVGETSPDKSALMIANFVLGGGNFSSRLMKKVRSETGRTYGIGSTISSSSRFGFFVISTSTQNSYLGDVLESIQEVQLELARDGVTEEELDRAKRYVVGNMAFELEGVGNVAEKLLWLRFYGRDNGYIEDYPRTISRIDRETVAGAIARHLASEHVVIAAVGRRSEIEGQLSGLGDVRVCSYRADPTSV
jgi:zinc protease